MADSFIFLSTSQSQKLSEVLKLRVEPSMNCSGELLNEYLIPELKEKDYYVLNIGLDGDAPKQFIRAYFFEKGSGVRKKNRSSWYPFIAKTAEKWYPHESIIEFMLNRIGQEMGLLMNEIKLVKANGQIRFLSKFFLHKNERLIHGAEICGEYLGDGDMAKEIAINRNTARELFTFDFIKKAIESVFSNCCDSILCELVKMIAFDALVGNNDRHFYNWGIIDSMKKTRKQPKFAPLYDSARGLLWNLSDQNIVKYHTLHCTGHKKVLNYIEEAYPRISVEGNPQINHFELIKYLKTQNKKYAEIVVELASKENESKVLKMLKDEFYPFFIPQRSELISIIITNRFQKVREA